MSDDVLNIEITEFRLLSTKFFLKKGESVIKRISTDDFTIIFYNDSRLGVPEIDKPIVIEVLRCFFDKLGEGDDYRDERDDIFTESSPDILDHIGI